MVDKIDTNRPHVAQKIGYNDMTVDFVRKVRKTWTHDGQKREAEGLVLFEIYASQGLATDNWFVKVRVKLISSALTGSALTKNTKSKIYEETIADDEVENPEIRAQVIVEKYEDMSTSDLFDISDKAREVKKTIDRRLEENARWC